MSRFLVVVNPTARRGNGARSVPAIRTALARLDVEYEMVQSERPGHAIEIAQQAASGDHEVVVAVGGDGTVNEVANGLLRAASNGPTAVSIGVIPVGSGNDFAYMMLGQDLTIEEACQRLVRGQDKLVDVGSVTANGRDFRFFANGLGIGFDAQVSIESRRVKVLRGFLMYFWAVLRTVFLHYNPTPVTVTCDDQSLTQPLLMVTTAVGQRHGGGFYVTPSAVADDGLLDVCIAGNVSRPGIFPLIPRFMKGSHVTHPKCTLLQGRKVTVSSQVGLAAHIDGEIYTVAAERFEMDILPARLWVRC
jgi:YegS/Rv2252/BmrU family lipid kinase